ncbi:hypothetical protein [Desulfosporosinus sp. OT]|uniref:hypothetical protein n=1 Tax=Desulfosporosinus sp. OT TaxID=913865 RepID=UPI000223A979|nr:hypothetical protein [Desulfosporosinus sp. OT]EGW37697.1 hypothetical protein DOT_4438 [Desulfosporosinus sp. OT]
MDFDFFVTASFFSILGYGLCYITVAQKKEIATNNRCQVNGSIAGPKIVEAMDREAIEINPLNNETMCV